MQCKKCIKKYHLQCLNISNDNFALFDKKTLASWICPSCTNVNTRRRGSNSETPVGRKQLPGPKRQVSGPEHVTNMSLDNSLLNTNDSNNTLEIQDSTSTENNDAVTMDKISTLLDHKIQTSFSTIFDERLQRSLNSFMSNFRSALQDDIKKMVQSEIKSVVQDLECNMTSTVDYICAEQAALKSQISDKNNTIKKLEIENNQLQSDLNTLNKRLLSIETMSRSFNIEVQAVPESRSENVLLLFQKLCSTIGMTIENNQITACRRVAKMDAKSNRPRNILVTLSSPRLRDSILSLARRFNKSHVKNADKMLNSSHLGITDKLCRIYVTEHISPQCKALYAETRKIAKQKNYQFVWVKFGRIFVRKNEESSSINIKHLDCLKKL